MEVDRRTFTGSLLAAGASLIAAKVIAAPHQVSKANNVVLVHGLSPMALPGWK